MEELKRNLSLDPARASYSVVGESWEVSVDPAFPSRIVGFQSDPTLSELVARDRVAALGPSTAERWGSCPVLVKLLDAAANLSVQVHPTDDHPGLSPDQSGKPESWIVLKAAPRGAVYLGFRDGVDRGTIESALASKADLEPLLNRVPVAPGDCFEIGPGVVHAIGAGVTLVEPQFVSPGRHGVTYRFWDWNRRYDPSGKENPTGDPRPLHVADALAVMDSDLSFGDRCPERLRRRPAASAEDNGAKREPLVSNTYYAVDRISGTGVLFWEVDTITACTVVQGAIRCGGGGGETDFSCGESLCAACRAWEGRVGASGLCGGDHPTHVRRTRLGCWTSKYQPHRKTARADPGFRWRRRASDSSAFLPATSPILLHLTPLKMRAPRSCKRVTFQTVLSKSPV